MSTKAVVDQFIAQKTLALAGASRSGRKLGNAIHRDLKTRGYRVLVVHPQAERLDGDPCWRSLAALPEPVDGVIVAVPPSQALKLVQEAAATGIRRVWLQPGSESPAAVEAGRAAGMDMVTGHCLLMFLDHPAWIHRFHRTLWGWLGKLPK